MPSAQVIRQILSDELPKYFPSQNVNPISTGNSALGRAFFVNAAASNEVDEVNGGQTWGRPLATLGYALTQCTANRGDEIHLGIGHTEGVTGAAGAGPATAIVASVAGVSVIGHGIGRKRPIITLSTSTAAQIVFAGANQKWKNIVFDFTGIDAIVAALSITGADVTFEDCDFITNSASAGCVLGVLTAATADRLTFRRCNFIGAQTNSGTTTTAQIKHEVGADLLIEDCYFTGKMTQAVLNATTVLRACMNRCRIHTYTGTLGLSFETSSTGLITDCRICVASGTTPAAGAAMSYSGNRYTTEGNGPTGGTADAI